MTNVKIVGLKINTRRITKCGFLVTYLNPLNLIISVNTIINVPK